MAEEKVRSADSTHPQPLPCALNARTEGEGNKEDFTQGGTAFALGYKYFAPMELSISRAVRGMGECF